LLLLLKLAEKYEWNMQLLDYKNSGDTAGNKDRVVGYSAMVATDDMLDNEAQSVLMNIARDTIEQYVREGTRLEPDMNIIEKYPKLMKDKAAFVSLDKLGRLRGSIGSLTAHEPLYLSVRNHAINTVSNDKRFLPVQTEELGSILITISVLEQPYLIQVTNYTDYLRLLRPLKDGVIIVNNGKQATYLPQVWEQLSDKEYFLSNLCMKATLEANCWKDPETMIYRYGAQVFYEKDFS
ncbi:AmmeMemoRadiSam system protein A, partial [Candidatus Woesearchaeota archaeon]|nr:AmmeMemoRadiSam system protein A [Candidatus Woesearchaeota archaeon]